MKKSEQLIVNTKEVKVQNKAYKFRIYPNAEQAVLFAKTFGCVRFIYNQMLADKIKFYEETKQKLNNTPAQYKQEFGWLKEVDSLALANAQMNLQKAYNNFFRSKSVGFPKFKSKKKSKLSYTTNNINNGTAIRIIDGKLKLPKVGLVKIKSHRQIPTDHKIKSATISKNPSGKYYVSILTEYEFEQPNIKLNKDRSIGLDYSSSSFYVDNQGTRADYPKFYRNAQSKLAKEQRKLSLMKLHSNNYEKQKVKVAVLHEHIANQRKDWIHKLSKALADEYDYICVEDINLRNISQGLKLGKSTNDNGFGMFRELLRYKLFDRGKQLITIDKWFPSSKMCSECGCIKDNLSLSERVYECVCGFVCDRDQNAAINIRKAGLLNIS